MPDVVTLSNVVELKSWKPEACGEAPRQVRFALNDETSDAAQIISFVAHFARKYATSPCVFEFARGLISDVTENNAKAEHLERVTTFVLENMVYVADPRGAEFVRSPIRLIGEYRLRGFMQGDCDDTVLLTNSLCEALGLQTRVAAVKLPGSDYQNHVVSQIMLGGVWHWFDGCNKKDPSRVWTGEVLFSR